MSDPPPTVTPHALIVYTHKRLNDIEEKLDKHGARLDAMSRRSDFLHFTGVAIKYSGNVASHICTYFVAGYIAIEHSWYVEKVVEWLQRILAFHF